MAPHSTKNSERPDGSNRRVHLVAPPTEVTLLLTFLRSASPLEMIELERQGIDPKVLRPLSAALGMTLTQFCKTLGVPRGAPKRLCEADKALRGAPGLATIHLLRLFCLAQEIVEDSAVESTEPFDVGKWLGRWIQTAQPSLGGRRPADFLDTPTGFTLSATLLGALRSNAYQ